MTFSPLLRTPSISNAKETCAGGGKGEEEAVGDSRRISLSGCVREDIREGTLKMSSTYGRGRDELPEDAGVEDGWHGG